MTILNNKRNFRSAAKGSGHEHAAHQGRLARVARKAYGLVVDHGNTLYNYRASQPRRSRL